MSIFDFGFESEYEVAILMMQSARTDWTTKKGDDKKATVEVDLGGRKTLFDIVKKGTDSLFIQANGQPFLRGGRLLGNFVFLGFVLRDC